MSQSLYKFLPQQYVESLLDGAVLFRNLVYFKSIEDDARRDDYEGAHVDAPDHDVQIEVVSSGRKILGRFAYHNTSMHLDRIFSYCLSMSCNTHMSKFGGACVEIYEPDEFRRRLEIAIKRKARLSRFETPLLLGKPVQYYKMTEAAPSGVDVKDPRDLSFLKRTEFESELEFRFTCARRGGYELKQMITTSAYSPSEEIAGLRAKDMLLNIGSIRDIARLMQATSAPMKTCR